MTTIEITIKHHDGNVYAFPFPIDGVSFGVLYEAIEKHHTEVYPDQTTMIGQWTTQAYEVVKNAFDCIVKQ